MTELFGKGGKGWFSESLRHSNAVKLGRAGPIYASGGKSIGVNFGGKVNIIYKQNVEHVFEHPKNKIVADIKTKKMLSEKDRQHVALYHEIPESEMMKQGMPYEQAHEISNKIEKRAWTGTKKEWDRKEAIIEEIYDQNHVGGKKFIILAPQIAVLKYDIEDAKKFKEDLISQGISSDKIEIISEEEFKRKGGKIKPKLIAYGSFNVYNIKGKAYYYDHIAKKFVRALERDYLIKKHGGKFYTKGTVWALNIGPDISPIPFVSMGPTKVKKFKEAGEVRQHARLMGGKIKKQLVIGFDRKTKETLFAETNLEEIDKLKKIYKDIGLKVGLRKVPESFKGLSAWL